MAYFGTDRYPTVSCIMPTRGRPQFARQAVEYFLAQTWPAKELLILDDFFAPSFSAPPAGDGIRYFSERHKLIVGAKRNRCCSEASGDIICHWDDDDYSAPGRIADQVARLLESGAEVTGYSEMEFRNGAKSWLYRGANGYMLGTSLMYWRDAWRRRPFADLNVAEDLLFQAGRKTASAPAGELMWASIHPGNTSPRQPDKKNASFLELTCA